ncbi:MAG TPA: methyltransferase domain-containing protein [Mycobacteriales bacterium]|nr:methyltransferase domain-containing protein [Mycobacteriales bacterium]
MGVDRAAAASWVAGTTAETYERGRPGYAGSAVAFVLAPVRDRPGLRALDLGAGTGKLTRLLVARGVDTVAVEPAAGMREVLARVVPAAAVLPGAAEAVPLPDSSVDLVVAGQAFHWFERETALAEIVRVLRPGGVLGIFYNARDDAVAWVRALSGIIGETADHASATRDYRPPDLGPRFGPAEVHRTTYEQPLDAGSLVDLVASRSYSILMAPAERAALLARVAELTRTHPALVGRQHFSMPYVTTAERHALRS